MNCRIMLFEALSIDDGKYYPRFGYNTDPCIGIGTRSFDSERGSGEFYKEIISIFDKIQSRMPEGTDFIIQNGERVPVEIIPGETIPRPLSHRMDSAYFGKAFQALKKKYPALSISISD